MKIRNAKVLLSCPGRNFVTLKIETDEGIYGIGDATLNGRELAVKAYLEEHVVPCLIGRDATRIEDAWQYLYRGAYWRRGPVTMTAIAAVDTALWDIKGKAAGLPVYQLLGGRSRDAVLVYGHANGRDHAEAVAAVGQYIDLGYKAIRCSRACPGWTRRMASARAISITNRRTRDCPTKKSGIPRFICAIRLSCSRRFAWPMATTSICCTIAIIVPGQ
jgi:mannonate dehydratase